MSSQNVSSEKSPGWLYKSSRKGKGQEQALVILYKCLSRGAAEGLDLVHAGVGSVDGD